MSQGLVNKENNVGNYSNSQHEINHCLNTIFIHPVTEEEVESLTKGLKKANILPVMMTYLNVFLNNVYNWTKITKTYL